MTLRIEVLPDCQIEIMLPHVERSKFLRYPNLEKALIVIEYLIKRERERVRGERFVPQIKKEAQRAFLKLKEKVNAEHKYR